MERDTPRTACSRPAGTDSFERSALGYASPEVDNAHRIDGDLPLVEQPFWDVVPILVVFTPDS